MAREKSATSLLETCRANEACNRRLIVAADVDPRGVPVLTCDKCGRRDSALFWTLCGRDQALLHLKCPGCERGSADYDLRRNMVRDRSLPARALSFGVAFFLTLLGVTTLVAGAAFLYSPEAVAHATDRAAGALRAPFALVPDRGTSSVQRDSRQGSSTLGVASPVTERGPAPRAMVAEPSARSDREDAPEPTTRGETLVYRRRGDQREELRPVLMKLNQSDSGRASATYLASTDETELRFDRDAGSVPLLIRLRLTGWSSP